MNIEELRKNPLIKNIVKTILDNDKFYESCEKSIKEIYADNKIDTKDIPIILNLLVSTYNNYSTISVDRKDIKEVFILLYIEIIYKLKWEDKVNIENTVEILSPQIDLLLISINSNINTNCLQRLFCCCCIKSDIKPTNQP
tara:strand:+ start:118 stop:540 length:423 start_codon:yes stop_codon:yes gene_type:complete